MTNEVITKVYSSGHLPSVSHVRPLSRTQALAVLLCRERESCEMVGNFGQLDARTRATWTSQRTGSAMEETVPPLDGKLSPVQRDGLVYEFSVEARHRKLKTQYFACYEHRTFTNPHYTAKNEPS